MPTGRAVPGVLGVVGVDEEIEACIRAQYGRLVGAVSFVSGSPQLAEEAVQEAFARAWERSQRGERFDHLPGWVATVALNQARSVRRRRSTERRALDRLGRAPSEPSGQRATETELVVRQAINRLAARQREAVVLYYLLDIDVATTAGLLGVSEGP